MNIFVLDQNPELCAQYHCDLHISKMVLESAQMLSTVLGGPYKPTHKNHPCTLWVAQTQGNTAWLIAMTYALNREWRMRYGHDRDHKSIAVIDEMVHSGKIMNLPNKGLTPFAQAMPDDCKNDDAVTAYRTYYKTKTFAVWNKGRTAPAWW